tara:strand:+ start:31 stop:219 length:189 start_codon:yes stop_codon:yes gene_type:complete
MATKFWVSSNEDSRANAFRARWASDNKGEWRKQGNLGWNWFPAEQKVKTKTKTTKTKINDKR